MTATSPASLVLVPAVIGGIDTHADTIHVAAIDEHGRDLGDCEFPTTPAGYAAALAFLTAFGDLALIGIEGTSSYGVGIARAAHESGIRVREVTRPDRAHRRMRGKSDPIDAYQAARAVLAGRAEAAAKDPAIEPLRALVNARRSAVKAASAAMHQIHQMLVNAPDAVREKYRNLTNYRLIEALCASRPGGNDRAARHVLVSLKVLAQRHRFLWEQADALEADIALIVADLNPGLLAAYGVGPNTAAQLLITAGGNPDRLRDEASFAALCGTAPVQASSGKNSRYRLSRGGDRAANSALHTIALVRMSCDPRTRDYVRLQRDRGRSSAEILRMLKRAIVREIFRCLTQTVTVPLIADLRPTRQSKNITLQTVATHFGVWPAHISEIERGVRRDDQLAQTYREWLLTA